MVDYSEATPEQLKRAQEQAYALIGQQPSEKVEHWTSGAARMLGALQGRMTLDQVLKAQAGQNVRAGQVGSEATQLSNGPTRTQTGIPGYNGAVPPMHSLPTQEQMNAYLSQPGLTPEQRQQYTEHIQKLAEPLSMSVEGGNLVGDPRTKQWTYVPKVEKYEQGSRNLIRRGQGPTELVLPGANPASGQTPVRQENVSTNTKETPIPVQSMEHAKSMKSGTWIQTPTGRIVQVP